MSTLWLQTAAGWNSAHDLTIRAARLGLASADLSATERAELAVLEERFADVQQNVATICLYSDLLHMLFEEALRGVREDP